MTAVEGSPFPRKAPPKELVHASSVPTPHRRRRRPTAEAETPGLGPGSCHNHREFEPSTPEVAGAPFLVITWCPEAAGQRHACTGWEVNGSWAEQTGWAVSLNHC